MCLTRPDTICGSTQENLSSGSYNMIAITKLSIAEKFPLPVLGIDPGSPRYKTNALTTEPKS